MNGSQNLIISDASRKKENFLETWWADENKWIREIGIEEEYKRDDAWKVWPLADI